MFNNSLTPTYISQSVRKLFAGVQGSPSRTCVRAAVRESSAYSLRHYSQSVYNYLQKILPKIPLSLVCSAFGSAFGSDFLVTFFAAEILFAFAYLEIALKIP